MSGRNPLHNYLNQIQRAAGQRGGGPNPRGIIGGFASLIIFGGGVVLFQNSLFNVDGGHRAIKYRRISGVSKEIYGEGTSGLAGGGGLGLRSY